MVPVELVAVVIVVVGRDRWPDYDYDNDKESAKVAHLQTLGAVNQSRSIWPVGLRRRIAIEKTPKHDEIIFTMSIIEQFEAMRARGQDTALLRYGGTSGSRMPSRRLLADRMRRSVDSVDRAMRDLETAGLVRVEHRRNGRENLTNRYHVRTTNPTDRHPAAGSAG